MKFLRLLSGAIVLLVLVVFLLSNRHPAPVSFWPFGPVGSAATGAVVLIAFAIGVLAGMLIHLPHRLRASRRARRAEQQVAALQARVQQPPPPPLSLSS